MWTGIIVMDVEMGEDEAERWCRQLKFRMVLIGGVCMTCTDHVSRPPCAYCDSHTVYFSLGHMALSKERSLPH